MMRTPIATACGASVHASAAPASRQVLPRLPATDAQGAIAPCPREAA